VTKEGAADRGEAAPRPLRLPSLAFDRLLLDWRGARDRSEAYARALGIDPHEGAVLVRRGIERAVEAGGGDGSRGPRADSLDALSEILVEEAGAEPQVPSSSAEAFERWRLAAWWAGAWRPAPPRGRPSRSRSSRRRRSRAGRCRRRGSAASAAARRRCRSGRAAAHRGRSPAGGDASRCSSSC